MSRKDYRAIAQALKEAMYQVKYANDNQVNRQTIMLYERVIDEISTVMKRDNYNFSHYRFSEACSIKE